MIVELFPGVLVNVDDISYIDCRGGTVYLRTRYGNSLQSDLSGFQQWMGNPDPDDSADAEAEDDDYDYDEDDYDREAMDRVITQIKVRLAQACGTMKVVVEPEKQP